MVHSAMMRITFGYLFLLVGMTVVVATSPTTTPDPTRMQEGRFLAETMRQALKKPGVADSLGQILPFLRVMPTRQRDKLAVMIRAALRPPQIPGGQFDSSDYALENQNGDGEDLLASAASPPNSIASSTDDERIKELSAEGGLPAMLNMAQTARKSNSTGVLADLLPNLDIVNLIRETVASVDGGRALQEADFQDRYGIPQGDLRRSGTRLPPSASRKRLPPPPGNNRRHSLLTTSKGNGPTPNVRASKPYEKIIRSPTQSTRRVILGGREKVRHPVTFPQKTSAETTINESFKNHLQAQAGCKYFGHSVCLAVDYYPREAILNSIRQRKGFADALLVNDLKVGGSADEDSISDSDEYSVCPTEVKSKARPKKAMTKSGVWKFIVNVDDLYTQSIRMEVCSRPGHQCMHVSPSDGNSFLSTTCTQVQNTHRLLAWDEVKGIHVDSFEIPTCCACHLTSPKSVLTSFSMSTSSTASTSSRPSLLLNPPPPSSMRRRPPLRGVGSSAGLPVIDDADSSETIPSKRGTFAETVPRPFRVPPPDSATSSPPVSTTPLIPRPLSPVAIQETWGSAHAAATRRPIPEAHHTLFLPTPLPDEEKPQRINYSYHPIFDFFRAGRLKDVRDAEDTTESMMASERSDDFSHQRHQQTFGDGWSPIITK